MTTLIDRAIAALADAALPWNPAIARGRVDAVPTTGAPLISIRLGDQVKRTQGLDHAEFEVVTTIELQIVAASADQGQAEMTIDELIDATQTALFESAGFMQQPGNPNLSAHIRGVTVNRTRNGEGEVYVSGADIAIERADFDEYQPPT